MVRAVLGLTLALLGSGACTVEGREASSPDAAPAPTPKPVSAPAPAQELDEPEVPEEPAPEPEDDSASATRPASGGGYTIYADPSPSKPRGHGEVPQVEAHEPMVGTPAIPAEVIQRVVRTNLEALRACYALGLAQDPAFAGRIAISFTIGPSGAVIDAKAETADGFPYPEVPKCIADELRTWTFPAPRGGGAVHVSYPFNLLPSR